VYIQLESLSALCSQVTVTDLNNLSPEIHKFRSDGHKRPFSSDIVSVFRHYNQFTRAVRAVIGIALLVAGITSGSIHSRSAVAAAIAQPSMEIYTFRSDGSKHLTYFCFCFSTLTRLARAVQSIALRW
jgi:hypothetical protein